MRIQYLVLAVGALMLTLTVSAPVQGAAPGLQADGAAGLATTTFDDRAGGDEVLSGHYPGQVIDWGAGQWYHASPWKGFTSKSVSFNGDGVGRASFAFVTPRRLIRLDAYNGGEATTLTLSCAGQPDKQVALSGGQATTIETGWGDTCTMVTIASTNGWDTNFDNLVYDAGG